jgi:hypothetical protein
MQQSPTTEPNVHLLVKRFTTFYGTQGLCSEDLPTGPYPEQS